MLVHARAIVALLLLASCDRAAERKLIGTWRAEKDGEVDEVAFRPDHTLVWWMCPAELSTPQTLVSSGEWRMRSTRIEMDTKLLTSSAPAEHHSLEIVKLTKDSLSVKPALEFHRLDVPSCRSAATGSSATAVEPNIVGTWQVHYHTHEFRYRFAPDHTVAVSGKVSEEFEPLWKGSWSVAGGDLSWT
jgi:hypothetical protein